MRSSASSRRFILSSLGVYIVIVLVIREHLFDPERGDAENDEPSGTYEEATSFPGTGHALARREPRVLRGHHDSGHQLHEESEGDRKIDKADKLTDGSKSLVDKYHKEWEDACHTIIDSNRDYVSYRQGVQCWDHCHNVLAIQNLDTWIGHAQAKLQASHIVQILFPKFSHIPHFISTAILYFCYAYLPIMIGIVVVNVMVSEERMDHYEPVFATIGMVMALSAFLFQVWFVLVLGTVIWAQSFATGAGLTEIFSHPEYSWASSWAEAATWLRNDYVPSNIIFYLILYAAVALLYDCRVRILRNMEATTLKEVLTHCCDLAGFVMIFSIVIALVFMAYQVFSYFLSAGTRGVSWSCSKSFSVARAGWLPRDFPYVAGVVYTLAAVAHGLMEQPASVSPSCKPDSRELSFGCIPHTVVAIMTLMVKSGSILVDVLLDCAQSIMFFCRGQPFFGALNITGILIQMATLLCQAAQGMAQDCTLLAALLQSDLIANFRSSLEAGMVLLQFHEKAYREALGETFLSMSISISAFFTTHFRFTSDLHLMLLSLAMSLNSIRSGIAESQEIVVAENSLELSGHRLCCQVLPRNHFYARRAYAKSRYMSRIGMLRVCEAIVPVTTAAVMMASSSARITYFTMVILSAMYFFIWYLRNNGTLLLETFAVAFRSIFSVEDDHDEDCGSVFFRQMIFGVGFIMVCVGSILWAFFWLTTPFLAFYICVFWSGSVTVPTSPRPRPIREPDEWTWLYTFADLALPTHLFSLLDDFSTAFAVKISYMLALWSILFGCSYYHPDFFDFETVTSHIIQARAIAFSTQWWHGTIQLVLIGFTVLCYLMMIALVYNLGLLRADWLQDLTDAVQKQSHDFAQFEEQLLEQIEILFHKGLCQKSYGGLYKLGCGKVVSDATLAQLVGMKLLEQIFGPPDRTVLFRVSIFPFMLEELLSGLTDVNGHWRLENADRPSFRHLPRDSCSLRVGGDLVPKNLSEQGMMGQPLPSTFDAKTMISSLSAQLSSNSRIVPIFLVLGCPAADVDSMENTLKGFLESDDRTMPSFKYLADHTKQLADDLAFNLKSPFFGRVVRSHMEKIQNVQDCLMKIFHHCNETCLYHYFMEGARQYRLSASDQEDEATSPGQITHDLLTSLRDAVESVPAFDTIVGEAYSFGIEDAAEIPYEIAVPCHRHALTRFDHKNWSAGWCCDDQTSDCTRQAEGPTIRWSCRECGYDQCRGCIQHWMRKGAEEKLDEIVQEVRNASPLEPGMLRDLASAIDKAKKLGATINQAELLLHDKAGDGYYQDMKKGQLMELAAQRGIAMKLIGGAIEQDDAKTALVTLIMRENMREKERATESREPPSES